ncbi:MFS transporter [Levilactobacillus sp. HBUAS70063]|uniref:MFS transporter n=1 Tax=Levilactobacillus sp. HBUAS70063 TaxID=3109359 RepID=UPI003133173C
MTTSISNRQSVIQIVKAASSDIIGTLGGDIFSFAVGLMLLHRTHSAISFGLGSIIYPVVGLLLVMPVGNLVDRRRHKPLILVSKLTVIMALLLYSWGVARVNAPMLLAIALLVVIAGCDKVTNTTFTAAVHELVNDNHVKMLATIEQAATAGIQLVAPVLAALLYGWIGFAGIVRVVIVTEVLTWLIALSMRFHPLTDTDDGGTAKSQWAQFQVGLRYIREHFTLLSVVLMGIFLNFLLASIDVGLPYAIVQERHLGSTRLSWVLSAFSGGVLLGNLVLSVLPKFKNVHLTILRLSLVIGSLIAVVGLTFMAPLTATVLVVGLIGIALVIGLVLAFVNTPMSVYMQMTVPTRLLGRVGSTFATLMQLALPLGTVVYGMLFQHIAAGPVYLVTGLVIVGYIALNLRTAQRHYRDNPDA